MTKEKLKKLNELTRDIACISREVEDLKDIQNNTEQVSVRILLPDRRNEHLGDDNYIPGPHLRNKTQQKFFRSLIPKILEHWEYQLGILEIEFETL